MLDWTSQEPASWLPPDLLAALRAEGDDRSIHLVGGAVRDRALGLPVADLDLVTDGDARQLAGALAARLDARLVDLGQERFAAYRLVGADGAIDLWGRGETPIEADLERRDLTVNSIAIDLENGALLDPFGGRGDLEARLLRATTEQSFREDPLRVLRLARFAATLDGFRIAGATLELARRDGLEVDRVAAERIREEVTRLLAAPRRDLGLAALIATGLYPRLWGAAGSPPDRDLAIRLARIETAATGLVHGLAEDLWEVDPTLVAQALLLAPLAAGRPAGTVTVATPLLIRRDRRRVVALLELGELPTDEPARRWLLRRWGRRWAEAAVFASLADSPAASPSAAARELASAARRFGPEVFELAPLVDGTEVARVLGVEPGPIIGRALAALEREQAAGRIASARAARDFLRVWRRDSGADED